MRDLNRVLADSGIEVDIGFLQEKGAGDIHDGSEKTIAEIAADHEFGRPERKPPLPERSFLRSTFDSDRAKLEKGLERIAKQATEGKLSLETGMGRIGLLTEGLIKKRIQDGIPPALSPVTIANRVGSGAGFGGDTPLLDTGQMVAHLTSVVRKGAK